MAIALTKLQHSDIEQHSETKLQAFQRKIYLKAKQNPDYKFYCLYDKVFRRDTLEEAYRRAKANKGAAGVDGLEWSDLKDKQGSFIEEIHQELKQKTYRPSTLREVTIPKKNGKMRTLKIPTIKDRVVQGAVKLIIEPIFEADFKDCSYGYRPKRGAQEAIGKLGKWLFKDIYAQEKKTIRSIDLKDCFNTIPHKELIRIIAQRVIDRQLLKLIKQILLRGAMQETSNRGTPQGGVLSPLLANIYLDQIDQYWKDRPLESKLLRYADDILVVLNRKEEGAYQKLLEHIEKTLKLTINREKSQPTTMEDGVDYLGFNDPFYFFSFFQFSPLLNFHRDPKDGYFPG